MAREPRRQRSEGHDGHDESTQSAPGYKERAKRNNKQAASLIVEVKSFSEIVAGVRDYAVVLLDREGNILTWNAGAAHIHGYREEEIVGQHFSRFFPKEAVMSGWPAHELEVATRTGRFEDDGWRIRKDGSTFWANVVLTALRDESGELYGFLQILRDFTDRRQGEERIRISEQRFRLIVDSVKDYAIFMLDPQGHVMTWNSGAARLKGYTAEEIIGQHFSRFYPQEAIDRHWPEEELRRAVADGRFEDEGWRLRKDGTTFWANVVITALFDEQGALRGFAKVTRDLTERRKAEENARRLLQEETAREAVEAHAEELDRQREQLHVTLSSIGDGVIVTDMHGMVTFLNPVAATLTGWRPEEAAGRPLEEVFRIVNEDTRQTVDNPVSKVLRDGVVVGLANHTILIARDGREIPIDDSGAPIRGRGGAVAGVVLVFRDVSEARRALESRLQLAAIVESSDDAIIGTDLQGRIFSWNRGAERLYGYSATEILGKPLSKLMPEDTPKELGELLERVEHGECVEHFETTRRRKDGTSVEVSLTISPIRGASGRIVGASKIARDITARKEEDRRKNEFLALLAHELRNPLAPLRSGLELIKLAKHDADALDETRVMMERQLQQLSRLVDDLLDVNRITQGTIALRRERVQLDTVVSSALDTCGPLMRQHKHQLSVHLPDEPVIVDGDKTRLSQVLSNILCNAAKYTPDGGQISLTVDREGREAVIRVRDTGIGIPQEMLGRVFDLFLQVDGSLEMSHGGLGVGLSIVKRLVDMHGGSVEAHSEGPGLGSEFIVRLPAITDEPSASEESTGPGTLTHGLRRILVIDDNVDAAASLSLMLRMFGNDVRSGHDGIAAVQQAEEFRPHMILMDIGMPILNGYEACRRIREQPWGKDIVIVALTGWGQEDDRLRSQEAGFSSHLVKPVEPAELQRLLAELDE